jgi:tetraprenyl-beta-curcumene synthase
VLCKTARPRVAVAAAFASAACRYWLGVFPTVHREISSLRRRARSITSSELRLLAIHNLRAEKGNLEGAAAFAAFVPHPYRGSVIRAQVAFQAAYDYVDSLSEHLPTASAVTARRLHCALLMAVTPGRPHLDYYARHACREDNGYLIELIDICRVAVSRLPAYPLVAKAIRVNTRRIIAYQSRASLLASCKYPPYVRWATEETPADADLRWWETGAACGSSMAVFALLAAAADPQLTPSSVKATETIYWPWAGALHTLLDSLIDHDEDKATGQQSLITHYKSTEEMTTRLGLIATEALRRAEHIGTNHCLILAGMVSLYLSDAQAWRPNSCPVTEEVLSALGALAAPAMLVLRLRRLADDPSGGMIGRAYAEAAS